MAGIGNNYVPQGNLNIIAVHIAIANYPNLDVTASYMTKTMAHITPQAGAVVRYETATGVVNSPMPYVRADLVMHLNRAQPLATAWFSQWQNTAILGQITAFSDSITYPVTILQNCVISGFDPGAFDGQDPSVQITLDCVLPLNQALWTSL